MPIDLYYVPGSAPCRAVLLTAKALNLNLNLKLVDLHHGEHLKPEYIKSRAIITYLVNKYGKGSSLYPEEPKARALVDQRLYFDIGTLYQRFADYFYPQVFGGAPADKDKLAKIEDALQLLNTFLEGQKFCAGPTLTLADLSLVASVSSFEASDVDFKKYPNIKSSVFALNEARRALNSSIPAWLAFSYPGAVVFTSSNHLQRVKS
ncbi:hypothetical protein SFRURICE_020105 [Spodoptera frugiperda]|nr:hypothetical protein SFRURICE_020105 [Spodoptera frugiperda]